MSRVFFVHHLPASAPKLLPLRCCQQAMPGVLTSRRRNSCSERCNRWDQAYRNRPTLPAPTPRHNGLAASTLLPGEMESPGLNRDRVRSTTYFRSVFAAAPKAGRSADNIRTEAPLVPVLAQVVRDVRILSRPVALQICHVMIGERPPHRVRYRSPHAHSPGRSRTTRRSCRRTPVCPRRVARRGGQQ